MGSLYLGLKARTVMAQQERAGQERDYRVDTNRSGESEIDKTPRLSVINLIALVWQVEGCESPDTENRIV